jgi:predicted MFS family arabinose efflux permease
MASPGPTASLSAATDLRSLRRLTWILAAACGLAVANLYYAQPLLDEIARAFSVGHGTAAVVVTVTQLGYAIGLVLLLPLGDLLENRALCSRLLVVTTAALVLAGAAPAFGLFLAASVLIGITSVVAQVLIPLAAHLAPPEARGQLVGRVMSGLLLGILLGRTVASLVAAAFGWRAIYFISAGLILIVALVLARTLPRQQITARPKYGALLRSIGALIREEPALRRRAVCQASNFGAFSAFWTVVTFELVGHHHLGQIGIAVFALVGAAGALAAPLAGRVADRGLGRPASGAALFLASASMVLAALVGGPGTARLLALALSGVLLDLAVQGHQVLSQQEIYSLRADARARINTVFMGTIFTTGAMASAVTGALYEAHGWTAAMCFAAALPAIGFGVWTVATVRSRRRVRGDAPSARTAG